MRNTTSFLLLIISIATSAFQLNAQKIESLSVDSLAYRLEKQVSMLPHEKLYIQIDKPYYVTGEDIWLRAHLADAYSGTPDTTSRYIYGELINPMDSVMKRVKIRPQNGAYGGYIKLEENMPAGDYQLRFYTRFMENQGDDYFFKRMVKIGDPLSALYRTEISFNYEENNKKANIELQIVEIGNNTLIVPDKIEIIENEKIRTLKPDKDNIVRLSLKAPDNKKSKTIYLEYNYLGKFHKEYITFPYPDDYEVSFLPEGGNFPIGKQIQIAFKALNSEGLGEDIQGIIVNEQGDTISHIQSQHLGMGSFYFHSDNEDKYYAICKNNKGLEKRYTLPTATNTITLQTQWRKDHLFLSVHRAPCYQNTAPLYLIVQCRGRILGVLDWNSSQEFIQINKEDLLTGVNQFLLVDADMNPLSERVVFNLNENDLANISYQTDKLNYQKRERVNISLKLSDMNNNSLPANLSIAVTDDNDITPDTCINILSTMLLTSELKGYIESPAYYFKDKEIITSRKLDLLMMTQGWTRYNVPKALQGEFTRASTYLELGQEISGTIKGGVLMNRATADYPVTLISMDGGVFELTTTNENGRFYFNGFETPDSIQFIVQGNSKRGGNRVELFVDQETFPDSKYTLPYLQKEKEDHSFENYQKKADHQFTLANGMRTIYLDDIIVTASAPQKKGKSPFSSAFNTIVTSEKIDNMRTLDIFQILAGIGGVMITGNSVSIRGAGGPPLILVDGMQFEVDDLRSLPVPDIDEIEVVKDAGAAIWGSRGANGVLLITTKTGEIIIKNKENFNIKTITPLGHQTTKEFYSPQYETKSKRNSYTPDLRTTIYWNPCVKVSENGEASIDFYTSDASSTTYSIVIEGITDDGKLIHVIEKISRED